MSIIIKNTSDVLRMREAAKKLSYVMDEAVRYVKPGISTRELDRICEELILKEACIPILKGYEGFPAAACISVNDQVGHGIPADDHFLDEGDIVKIDTSLSNNGYCADCARTIPVGNVVPVLLDLIEASKNAFYAGFNAAAPGAHINDIGTAIETYVTGKGYSVVRDMMGHGIGRELHEDPEIPHFNTGAAGDELVPGMVICIEPMINMGDPDIVWGEDDWTVYTEDYSFSAHYENTVLIGENGPEILTVTDRA